MPLLKEAVETFAKPTVADYYFGRGLADLGLYPEAVDPLEKAAAAAPESEVALHAYYKLSQVDHKMQRPADARNALGRVQKLQEQKTKQGVQELADWKKMKSSAGMFCPCRRRRLTERGGPQVSFANGCGTTRQTLAVREKLGILGNRGTDAE